MSVAFAGMPLPEKVHIDALLTRLTEKGDFSLSFPGNILCVKEGDVLFFREVNAFSLLPQKLHAGENILSDGGRLYVMEKDSLPPDQNVYTLSIQVLCSFATIDGGLHVRSKTDGDAYRTGGMTRKLKKLFSDAGIPPRLRSHLPVVCDDVGLLWVPPFGARDGEGVPAWLYYAPPEDLRTELFLHLAPRIKKKTASLCGTLK